MPRDSAAADRPASYLVGTAAAFLLFFRDRTKLINQLPFSPSAKFPKSGSSCESRAKRDLRGEFPRVLVRVPTGTQPAPCAGCTHRRDQQQESELYTRRRYSVVLHGSLPGMGRPLPGTPDRR